MSLAAAVVAALFAGAPHSGASPAIVAVQAEADGKLHSGTGLGELDPQVEASMPVCAAVASDETTGALGNGDAATEKEAVDGAMGECRSAGGKECRITSVACDPTRSAD